MALILEKLEERIREKAGEGARAVVDVELASFVDDICTDIFAREGVVDGELAKEGEGRRWNDHGPEWVGKEGKRTALCPPRTDGIRLAGGN